MNKRQAKREACLSASKILDSTLGVGWPYTTDEDSGNEDRPGRELDMVAEAMSELAQELWNRGAPREQT